MTPDIPEDDIEKVARKLYAARSKRALTEGYILPAWSNKSLGESKHNEARADARAALRAAQGAGWRQT